MTKPKRGERSSDPIDTHVGARIREHRLLAGLTLERLGELIGVTMGQVQKYESGLNRISAGRLFEIARVLHTPISSFYEGLETKPAPKIPYQRNVLEISRNFAEIPNDRHREALAQVTRALAGGAQVH